MVSPEAMKKLTDYPWPGNVRELEHAVERSLILSRDQVLTFDDIGQPDPAPAPVRTGVRPGEKNVLELDQVLRRHLVSVLKMAGGRINGPGGAADLLKINPSTLRQKLRRLDIPFGRKVKKHYNAP
jgi:DNA-binding NtrC family response regulator